MNIKFYGTPEIQAKARWEVGEMTDKGCITDIFKDGDFEIYEHVYKKKNLIWLPSRYGEVEGWLSGICFEVEHHPFLGGNKPFYSFCGGRQFRAPSLIEALIQLWMWVNFRKVWKEGEWTI